METNRVIELLEKQNAILQAQLNEQRMLNQQMYEMIRAMSVALNINSVVQKTPEPEEQEPTSFR
jgi:hypothetical protein